MAFNSYLPRKEPYSIWERKHANPRVFPFSDIAKHYYCFKRHCDFRLSSIRQVLVHERLYHSEYPLTGKFGEEDLLVRMEDKRDAEHEVLYVTVWETEEDVMRRKMMRIATDFFERSK